jgi:hypothetical protein
MGERNASSLTVVQVAPPSRERRWTLRRTGPALVVVQGAHAVQGGVVGSAFYGRSQRSNQASISARISGV